DLLVKDCAPKEGHVEQQGALLDKTCPGRGSDRFIVGGSVLEPALGEAIEAGGQLVHVLASEADGLDDVVLEIAVDARGLEDEFRMVVPPELARPVALNVRSEAQHPYGLERAMRPGLDRVLLDGGGHSVSPRDVISAGLITLERLPGRTGRRAL